MEHFHSENVEMYTHNGVPASSAHHHTENRHVMHYLYSFLPTFLARRQPVPPTAAEIRVRSARREEMLRLH